ncbi:MAG: bifunctional folylpolyglutamate synthase/dihydrofolate synthase [Chloroflexi bacterium]|nr:bifunctional folylpolyglutamate synthase/dihydrofolate synthase [Chloroflexota bacterium]
MDYQAALDYVLSLTDYETIPGLGRSAANFDLRRTAELLHRLEGPHLKAATVHVAGTKGKGSTAAMVASALTTSGYVTGLFTSPHLHSIRERITVDGEPIPRQELADLVNRLRPHVDAVNLAGHHGKLTTFELLTVLGFVYFQEKKVSFQVLEVGLGGRLDATNVAQPLVCIITPISFDHTEILGNSVTQIATEKAGIIKPGCTVVTAPQPAEAMRVIQGACRRCQAELIEVGDDIHWRKTGTTLEGQSFDVCSNAGSHQLTIPLLGEHQLDNAAAAVAALGVLARSHARITPQSISRGLAAVSWPGRLQLLRRSPLVVADGAHNVDSARKLKQALMQYFNFRHLILIAGTSSDKDNAGIVAELAPASHTVIVTSSLNPRATPPQVLAHLFREMDSHAIEAESVAKALEMALATAGPEDLVCITGSMFVVAEAIEHLQGIVHEA